MKNQTIATVAIFGLGLIAQSAQAQQWGVPIPQPGYANSTPTIVGQPLPRNYGPAPQIVPGGQLDTFGRGASIATGLGSGGTMGARVGAAVGGPYSPYTAAAGLIAGAKIGAERAAENWPQRRDQFNSASRAVYPQSQQPQPNVLYQCPGYSGQVFQGGCPR
jgi:hypothetical protein